MKHVHRRLISFALQIFSRLYHICICITRYPVDGIRTKCEKSFVSYTPYIQSLRYFIKYLACNPPQEVRCDILLPCLSFLEGTVFCWLVGLFLSFWDSFRQLASNLLCSLRKPWMSRLPTSTSQVLWLQAWSTMLQLVWRFLLVTLCWCSKKLPDFGASWILD